MCFSVIIPALSKMDQRRDEDLLMALALLVARRRNRRQQEQLKKKRRPRRWWVRPWIARRPLLGQYNTLFAELDREFEGDYRKYIRMDRNLFAELVMRVGPRLQKSERSRPALDPGLRLVVTLQFLASRMSYQSLEYAMRVAKNTICLLVPEVCAAIYEEYHGELLRLPTSPDEWRQVAHKFATRWNFPNAVGAIDGKHVAIKKPANSGSLYYNYKGFFSLVLLAVVDADYKFMWASVGAEGSASDCGIFNRSSLGEALEDQTLGLPEPAPLPGDDRPMPFHLIGDDAFPLRPWMMKPFAARGLDNRERIFNYRLSRARRIVENAFGILVQRWAVLQTTIALQPRRTVAVVKACLVLHNLIRVRKPRLASGEVDTEDIDGNVIPGEWRRHHQLTACEPTGGNRSSREAKVVRSYLADYFMGDAGSVPWQQAMVDV